MGLVSPDPLGMLIFLMFVLVIHERIKQGMLEYIKRNTILVILSHNLFSSFFYLEICTFVVYFKLIQQLPEMV
jgi:hypothetical protein